MKLSSIFPREGITLQLSAHNRQEVLRELADLLCKVDPKLSSEELYAVLDEREKLGSTGIGSGVAIPHGKSPVVKQMVGCFGRSREGIDFESQDGERVHLFFALVAPENAAGFHLKVLSRLSRLLKDASIREKLLRADKIDEVIEIISKEDEKV